MLPWQPSVPRNERCLSQNSCLATPKSRSGGSDLVKQVRVTLKHFEQLHQGQWRLCLTILVPSVPREGIDAAAENYRGFALAKIELLAHADNEFGIDDELVQGA